MEKLERQDNMPYKRLGKEEFTKALLGGEQGMRKKHLLDILQSTEDAVSTSELRDLLKKIDPTINSTDDVLVHLTHLHKEGSIEKVKHGITYFWKKKDD